MARIFISYSSRDERAAVGLKGWLAEHRHETILVPRIKKQDKGDYDDLKDRVEDGISRADAVLLLVTPFWKEAKLAQWELAQAKSLHKPLLFVVEAPTPGGFSDEALVIDMTRNRGRGLADLRLALEKTDLSDQAAKGQEGGESSGGVSGVKLQGAVISDHDPRTKKGAAPQKPVTRPSKRRERQIAKTLKVLRRGIRWNALPSWLGKMARLPVTGTLAKLKIMLFSWLKMPSLKGVGFAALGRKALSWVFRDKTRMIASGVAFFILATTVLSLVSDRTFGDKAAIKKELASVKKRQSLFLSRVAAHLHRTGEHETALLLSLEAMGEAQGADDLRQARDNLYAAFIALQKNLVITGHENHVSGAQFSPDGKFILSASWDRTARIWKRSTRRQVRVFGKHEGFVNSATFSPDQSLVLTAALDNKSRLFNARTGKLIRTLKGHSHDLANAAFSANGRRIVTASGDQTARIWDVAGGKVLKTFLGHNAGLEFASFSPTGSHIVTASADKTARILDVASGKLLVKLKGHGDVVRSARYDAAGKWIVTASQDKTARLFDARNGVFVRAFNGHQWAVLSAAFSPDSNYLVTASKDKTARIWNVKTGEMLWRLAGHTGVVSQASFSPDGHIVVTSSGDGTIRLWPVMSSDKELVRRARKSVSQCLTKAQRKKYFLLEDLPAWCRKINTNR